MKNDFKKQMLNAGIVGGIAFFSAVNVAFPPTMAHIYTGAIAMALTFLLQMKKVTENEGLLMLV